MAKEEENQPKIMTRPLPDILEELETWHNDNKALIEELRHLYSQLQEALEETTEATTEAHKAAAEAREAGVKAAAEAKKAAADAHEAGLKAAEKVAMAAHEEIAAVRQYAEDALGIATLVGMALMTAADGARITSENLIEALKTKFEFKK